MKKLRRLGTDFVQIGILPSDEFGGEANPDGLLQTYTQLRRAFLGRLTFILRNHIHKGLVGKNITFSITPRSISRSAPDFDYVYGELKFRVSRITPGLHFMKPLFSGISKDIITVHIKDRLEDNVEDAIINRLIAEG